ncbi:ribosomal protein L11 methyltransferase [Lactobacillus selangorensis]|uniref:Ribosomal protein L11 methyltransferase n=1 Tax=Lactobacillus selangorensis TaxID=81857 RepID=A0A0R2FPF7_9LACO|nr:50S ribosomal protein L11 methyltransferase [Lactobacillus selangorensis]KRN29542.1 ribosomal protein L11 methyltransferase [Lactobacillus selangorensis]KRN33928.1 ribosomal protein L11 methyltransferase [Lactobacillus selangorensis]
MEWQKLTVFTSNEAVAAVANLLLESGVAGIQIEDAADLNKIKAKYGEAVAAQAPVTNGAQVSAYFQSELPDLSTLQQHVTDLAQFGLDPSPARVEVTADDDSTWKDNWEAYYHPLRVTRYLTVAPSWSDYQPQQVQEQVIRLDPGQSFGTGTHPTTVLSLEALEQTVRGGESMIDVGTGSGVLSIAAKLLGAADVAAYDVDQVAVVAAQKNIALNPDAGEIKTGINDLLKGIVTPVDLIVANILPEALLPLIPQAKALLNPNGHFLLAGIIAARGPEIQAALEASGFQVVQQLTHAGWVALIAEHAGKDE